MIDWAKEHAESFSYYVVDPDTWRELYAISTVTGCTIDRAADGALLESASITLDEDIEPEAYVRVYLDAEQRSGGASASEHVPLGTFLVQTPRKSHDAHATSRTLECYSPLLELKDDSPSAGYTVSAGRHLLDEARRLCEQAGHAPVVSGESGSALAAAYTRADGETYRDLVSALLAMQDMELSVDPYGRIVFAPARPAEALRPVWTYTDDNSSSIIEPEVDEESDWYGLPNALQVVWSDETHSMTAEAVNDDPNSKLSTVRRGRRVKSPEPEVYEAGSPPTQDELDAYAQRRLKQLSTVEHTISYKHGYCPVKVGDCVRLLYRARGIDATAKVVSQRIECETGCSVEETATYTEELW